MDCKKDEIEAYDRDTKKPLGVCVKATIGSVRGPAEYEGTEVERNSRWSQDYWTRDGFYVLHDNEMHHVYHARPERYVVKAVIDGKERKKEFNTIGEAIAYQEDLVFNKGIDAEVQ